MAVLERSELEASPLADLHAIADQLGLDGFRRLRKAELIDAILGDEGSTRDEPGEPGEGSGEPGDGSDELSAPRRGAGGAACPPAGEGSRRASRRSFVGRRSRRSTAASKEQDAPRRSRAG